MNNFVFEFQRDVTESSKQLTHDEQLTNTMSRDLLEDTRFSKTIKTISDVPQKTTPVTPKGIPNLRDYDDKAKPKKMESRPGPQR